MKSAPVLQVRLIPGKVSVFEAVQFVLLLGEAGVLEGPEGMLWVAPGMISGASCPPGWTGEKALERIWLRTREGTLTFSLSEQTHGQELAFREMDLLEFQARSDEFWGLLRSRGLDLTRQVCLVDDAAVPLEVSPDVHPLVERLRAGPCTLRELLDSSPVPDLMLTRVLLRWMDEGWVRTTTLQDSARAAPKTLRTVVIFAHQLEELQDLFNRMGLDAYQKRRGRHVITAYLETPGGRVHLYGIHGLTPETPVLFLRPLIQRAHLVLVASSTTCPPELERDLTCPCLPLEGNRGGWYLNQPGEDFQASLIRRLFAVS